MRIALLTAVATLATVACEPEERPAFRATVCLQLTHHGVTPDDATVYRAAASDFPGYGADMLARFDVAREMSAAGRVCFDDVNVGSHWFAAEGWDEFIRDSVRGSKQLDITTRQASYELELQVSEQH